MRVFFFLLVGKVDPVKIGSSPPPFPPPEPPPERGETIAVASEIGHPPPLNCSLTLL